MPEVVLPPPPADAVPAPRPLYQQIKALITRRLQAGDWKPGEVIPSEMELAAHFGVSQGTVRKAVDELAAENLLVRRQGKGTFVATHAEEKVQYRFLRLQPDDGERRGLQRRLLDCRRQRPPAGIARALALGRGESCVQVRRLLLDEGRPVVPQSLFKGLTAESLESARGPLYRLFERQFGVSMIRAQEKIRAVAADAEQAALLGVPEGAPLLSVDRLSYTYDDRPVEFRRGLYDTRSHHYLNELS